jgi:predicted Zn-dependent protease
LNAIGAKGNSLITDYNEIVNNYNEEFSEPLEFTQGDFTGDAIHIYQFDSEGELAIVLAHEFGHALSLDHVENEKSIMYHFMGGQDSISGISTEDIAEFHESCDQKSMITKFFKVVVPFL